MFVASDLGKGFFLQWVAFEVEKFKFTTLNPNTLSLSLFPFSTANTSFIPVSPLMDHTFFRSAPFLCFTVLFTVLSVQLSPITNLVPFPPPPEPPPVICCLVGTVKWPQALCNHLLLLPWDEASCLLEFCPKYVVAWTLIEARPMACLSLFLPPTSCPSYWDYMLGMSLLFQRNCETDLLW